MVTLACIDMSKQLLAKKYGSFEGFLEALGLNETVFQRRISRPFESFKADLESEDSRTIQIKGINGRIESVTVTRSVAALRKPSESTY